ncbi:MAG: LytTR family DNA-binding domain-containing protein [Clostridia bacterium]|nr:LytTR family DNA-binding domain-containing protein [Clostridia bacterium]
MKIKIETIANLPDTEVIIRSNGESDDAKRIAATLRLFDKMVPCRKDGINYAVPSQDVFYFECVNDRIFCYTEKEVYETSYRLYELEEIFARTMFLRVNKYTILNADKIEGFKSALNGRMEAMLTNGEKIEISRYYVPALKVLLGGKI